MFLDDMPEVIKNLSEMEQRLLLRIIPFIKIIKLGGQSGFREQAVLFAQDIEEISNYHYQLQKQACHLGMIIVCE